VMFGGLKVYNDRKWGWSRVAGNTRRPVSLLRRKRQVLREGQLIFGSRQVGGVCVAKVKLGEVRTVTPETKVKGFLLGITKLVTIWVKRLNPYLRARSCFAPLLYSKSGVGRTA
jgi:hypothetical protein